MAAGVWIMCCSGGSYLYADYSGAIKDNLHYDQETLDTVAFFKELGENVGLLSGILYDVWPLWAVFLLGACQVSSGYLKAYLSVSGATASPQPWAMSLYLGIGANGQTFFITAVLVSLVKRFPMSRGMVIGVMKGLVGLSAAVLSQFAKAIYPQHSTSDSSKIILFLAWFPASIVALSYVFFSFQPTEERDKDGNYIDPECEEDEPLFLSVIAGSMISLAAFLLTIIMLQNTVRPFPQLLSLGVCFVMLTLLLFPLGVVYISRINTSRSLGNGNTFNAMASLLPAPYANKPSTVSPPSVHRSDDSYGTFSRHSTPNLARVDSFQRQFPARGEDHTVWQALCNLDFWLLVAISMIGLGTGLTAIDNVGQVGSSLGYSEASINSFVSMVSIWNFLGRLGAGALSEFALHEKGLPRSLFIMLALMVLALGHTILAVSFPGALYLGIVLIGSSFGAHWSLIPTATSELFGLKHFGTLLNAVTMASPLGSYVMSVHVAGFFYDAESQKQHPSRQTSNSLIRRSLQLLRPMRSLIADKVSLQNQSNMSCTGAVCFRLTFFIMAGACGLGCILSAILVARTRKFYTEVVYETCQLRRACSVSRSRHNDTEQPSDSTESVPFASNVTT